MSERLPNDQLLELLGIERYRLRAASGSASAPAAIESALPPPVADVASRSAVENVPPQRVAAGSPGLAELRASLEGVTDSAASAASLGAGSSSERPPNAELASTDGSGDQAANLIVEEDVEEADSAPLPPVDLLCLASAEIFIAAPATQSPDCHRLLEEMVIALSLPSAPARLAFRWPDAALGSAPAELADGRDGRKAWAAFWDRRAEPAKRRFAVDDSMLRSLLDGADVVWLPALVDVVGSADNKRALWQLLRDAR